LTFGGTDETASHKESYSGQKSKVRSFSIGGDRTIKGTWHQVTPSPLPSCCVAPLPDCGRYRDWRGFSRHRRGGDVIKLDKPYNVSDLVITDSAGSPVTLDPEHYDAFLEHGSIELLSFPAAPR
jgi:hypothetical protein